VTYENRLTSNYAFGTLTAAAAISDTTLTSADFATRLSSGLSTTTYVPITLQDPSTGVYEIVWANAHTAAATTCTVLRGREGTTARAWGNGTLWVVAPTLRDGVLPVANRAALPTDPHVGLRAFIQDEQLVLERTLAGWMGPDTAAFHTLYTNSATQAIPTSTLRKIYLPTAINTSPDVTITAGTTTTGSHFTLNRAGVWTVEGGVAFGFAAGTTYRSISLSNDTGTPPWRSSTGYSITAGFALAASITRRFAVNQKVAIWAYHEQGGNVDVGAGEPTSLSMTWVRP
jgi:hypothetical protein